jgi:hypothetical protein
MPVISNGSGSIVVPPNVDDIDIISSIMSLFVCVSGSEIAAGFTRRLSIDPIPLWPWGASLPVLGSRLRMRSQWSRHISATSQSSSFRTRRSMAQSVSTLARHDRAISPSVVSSEQRTSSVAVDVRWKALSTKVLVIMEKIKGGRQSAYMVARTPQSSLSVAMQ